MSARKRSIRASVQAVDLRHAAAAWADYRWLVPRDDNDTEGQRLWARLARAALDYANAARRVR